MKLWWVHCECLISTLTAYKLTGDEKYFEKFERLHEYAFSHFADKEYGEWYERYLTRRKARSGKGLIICRVALCSAS